MNRSAQTLLRDLFQLLPPEMKPGALLLILSTLIASVLEILGLAVLIPLISLLVPGTGHASMLERLFETTLPAEGAPDRTIVVLALCAITFIAKNTFLAAHAWLEARFSFDLYERLSATLLRKVLASDYASFRGIAPSRQLSTLTAEIVAVIFHGALPGLTLFAEILFLSAIIFFLLLLEPQVTLYVSITLVIAATIIIWASRRMSLALGKQRQHLEAQRNSLFLQAFTGIREIILADARQKVGNRLINSTRDLTGTYRQYQLLSTMPRFVLELGVITVLLAIIFFDLRSGIPPETIIVQVGVFAASGFRIMIGANRMVMSIQSLRFGQPAIAAIAALCRGHDDGGSPPASSSRPHSKPVSVDLASASYRYGNDRILDSQTIAFQAGTITGITGRSGCGKSTLLDLLAGLLPCESGSIRADGIDIRQAGNEWRKHIGFVSQTPYIFSDTIRCNIALGIDDSKINDDEVWTAIEGAQLGEFVRSLPAGLDTRMRENASELSGGQRQRIGIARALYRHADILLLDEPTASLDTDTERLFMTTLQTLKRDLIVVLVTHSAENLRYCDRVVRLEDGALTIAAPL